MIGRPPKGVIGEYKWNCLNCGKERELRLRLDKKLPKFCSLHCTNEWQRGKSMEERFKILEPSSYKILHEKFIMNMSNSSLGEKNKMYGKHRTAEEKIHLSKIFKGKSFNERFGIERSLKIRKKISDKTRGSNNPSFGKCYNGGKSIKGYYRDIFFRSILEFSFMRHLEDNGIDLKEDLDYENFVIPYKSSNGNDRTYRTDFYLPKHHTVYEVKQSYAVNFETNKIKFEAARQFFEERKIKFLVITEKDFRKIPFDEVAVNPAVQLIQSSFKSFKKGKQ